MFHFTKAVIRELFPLIKDYMTWMNKYSKHPERYPIEKRYQKLHKLMKRLQKSLHVDIYVEGLENVPSEACCFVPNHLSSYDPLALISIFDKPTTFVAKKEIEKMFVINKCIKAIDGLFLDRGDLKQSLRVMMKVQADLTNKKDKSWIIFPEGTRNKDSMHLLKEFHHGTFRAAQKSGVPIVPIAIWGTNRVLKTKPQFKRYPVFIKILKPITKDEYQNMSTQEIALKAQNMIQEAICFDLRIKDHKEMIRINKKHYRFNKII